MNAISFHVSEEANKRSVDIDLTQQFAGFALSLQQRHPGANEAGQVVRAPLDGMGRTHRVLQADGKTWLDDFGKQCPAPGRTTYNTGFGNAQMNCGMD